MRFWFVAVVGLLFMAAGAVFLVSNLKDRSASLRRRALGLPVPTALIAVGVWLARPLLVLPYDWLHGTDTAVEVVAARAADLRAAESAQWALAPTRLRTFAAFAGVFGPLLARAVLRTNPASVCARLSIATLPLGCLAFAAPALAAVDRLCGTSFSGAAAVRGLESAVAGGGAFVHLYVVAAYAWVALMCLEYAAGLHVGPLNVATTTVLIGVACAFLSSVESDDALWKKVLLWTAAAALGLCAWFVRKLEANREFERRTRLAADLFKRVSADVAAGPPLRFGLFLRPFSGTGTFDAQVRDAAAVDLESLLERALGPATPLLALGSGSEALVVGAMRVFLPNAVWWNGFVRLADQAAVVFVVPCGEGETAREIEWLARRRFLSKCVFVMPETVGRGGVRVDLHEMSTVVVEREEDDARGAVDHGAAWTLAQERVSEATGLRLPDYDPRGALVLMDVDGVRAQFPLGLASTVLKGPRVARLLRALGVDDPARFPSPGRAQPAASP